MSRSEKSQRARRGTILVGALACLSIVIAMVMFTVQTSLRGRKQARQQRQLLQTELLCEAGVKRAVQQLAKSSQYRGEKWEPSLAETPFDLAIVEIRIQPSTINSDSIHAEIVASLSSSELSSDRMQRSHTFEINVSTQPQESKP